MRGEGDTIPAPDRPPGAIWVEGAVGWKSFARELDRAQRRAVRNRQAELRAQARFERVAARQQRELDKLLKQQRKLEEAEAAKLDVAQFENYLEMLVSVHKQPGLAWDWQASAGAPPPAAPLRGDSLEREARAARDAYTPGFFERLFGRDAAKIAKLDMAIVGAQHDDGAAHAAATVKWQEAYTAWEHERALGSLVLAREHGAYGRALEYAGAFDEVSAYGATVAVGASGPDALLINIEIVDAEIVPTEVVKLTGSGKLTSKPMPKGQYWDLFQDHVCSCAIRVASEAFAALPVARVVVNSCQRQVSEVTGHAELVTKLAVHFTREEMARLNLDRIDPSSSMSNFAHRMKFAKTAGFKPVEAITLDEQFITT